MGFYDQGHTVEKSDSGDILTYQKGWVRHLAATRVPIRTSTEIGVWEEKSMVTKHSDAKSIVGDELADALEETRKQVGKSETEELVVKANEEGTTNMDDMMAACVEEKMKDMSEEEATMVCEGELKAKSEGSAWTPPPKGWTAASLEKYWASIGGTVTSCMSRAEGNVDDPAKFCASLKDKVTGTTKWRGPEKKKADVGDEEHLAEFEKWLYEEQSEAKLEEEVEVEKMIKDEGGEVVLYSKDGSKVLGRFPYGKGKKYIDKDAAMAAAKKREGQVQFFKHQKSESEDELEEKSGGEEVEKAGRRLQKQRVDEIAAWISDMKGMVTRGEDFLAWASQTQLTDSISEPQSRENPVEAVLASRAGDENEDELDIDDDLSVFARAVQEALESDMEPEEKSEYIQESLNKVGKAIAEVMVGKATPVKSQYEPEMEYLGTFNEKVKAALSSQGLDRRAKFAALQDALSEVGTFLQKAVVDTTPPSQGDLQALITEAVRQGTQPLVQENATLKARLTDLETALQTTQNVLQYPVQKSLTATPIMRQPVKKSGGKFSAADVARMTTTEAEVGLLY